MYTTHFRPNNAHIVAVANAMLAGAKIYFKRDRMNHTGLAQGEQLHGPNLLARRWARSASSPKTGAGQHGVATATMCALFGLKCVVYMGATDIERQKPNVFRMKLLGADVVSVTSGAGTLKDAMNEAMRDWVANVDDTYYLSAPSPARTPIR